MYNTQYITYTSYIYHTYTGVNKADENRPLYEMSNPNAALEEIMAMFSERFNYLLCLIFGYI